MVSFPVPVILDEKSEDNDAAETANFTELKCEESSSDSGN